MSNADERLCIKCLQKDPPVETRLVVGINITEHRWNNSRYWCTDCDRVRQKGYRAGAKEKFAEYLNHLKLETIEELAIQWEDLAYKRLPIAERVYRVWNKANRRDPSSGIRKAWILEVIMPDLWNADANAMIEAWFTRRHFTTTRRIASKPYVLEFLIDNRELLQAATRKLAENRWDGIVESIDRDHAGRDKMVAMPPHADPIIKEYVDNWFLLSREQEQKWRQEKRAQDALRAKLISQEEKGIVELHRVELEKQRKHETDSEEGDSE